MRQLGELNKNGAKEFEELGVEVVAVFREEREGLAGLKKIKVKTKAPFTLALDTPKKATAAYSNGRMKFHNYVVDKNGVIQGVIDGSLRSRAQAAKLLDIVKSTESDSAGMAGSTDGAADDKAAVQQAVLDFADGIYQANSDMVSQVVHPDAKISALGLIAKGKVEALSLSDLLNAVSDYRVKAKSPANAPRKVEVLDVTGELASAKLTSEWGTDMIHLVKVDGKWKLLQILQVGSKMKSK